ncbi:hypothetical protein PFAG_02146 [Plasmodium falciparum Santa Lucia]|nr:hypothetical protein PFBG_02230 [Plasmodium falciparum 7G8]EUT87324.1 hypothetical protein PFAG_02146 [Plasmodium falciparum Santa Lucia]
MHMKLIDEVLTKWRRKEINLFKVCLYFHCIKKSLKLLEDKNDFFINLINDSIFEEIINLSKQKITDNNNNSNNNNNNNNNNSFNDEDKFFFVIFVTFIFNLENEYINDQNKGLLHLINNDNNKEYEKNIQHNKDKLKQNNKNIRDNSSQNLFNQNKYKKIDILIKNIIDLEISQHISSPPKENKFINYKIYAYYAIIQFIFHILQNNDEQAGKIFSKYIKNIFTTLLNINHTILCNENILSLANKTLLFIVFINHHLIKDNEKEFFNFLFIQLNKYNEYMLPIIQEIFVTYLKKKKKLMLNKEIYQYLDNYLNDNISLLLKYGKKENLFFFLNVLSIYKIFIKKYISNNDQNVYTIKNEDNVHIILNIKHIINNVNKLLEYLVHISKDYIYNNTNIDISLYNQDSIYYNKPEENTNDKRTSYFVDNIIKEVDKEKYAINSVQSINHEFNTTLVQNYSLYQNNNLFSYITYHICTFFNDISNIIDTECISINTTYFIHFMKPFLSSHNNEDDLFLTYFLIKHLYTYTENLLKKCPIIFDGFVNYIMYLFKHINLLTKNNFSITEQTNLINILNKIKNVEHVNDIVDIYCTLYIHLVQNLSLFLKYLKYYNNEEIKEKILVHYEYFIFHVFHETNNVNFHIIFKNNNAAFVTLKLLYNLLKINNFHFENIHNIYFKLCKVQNHLQNIHEQNSQHYLYTYQNHMANTNSIFYLNKIKTFLLNNLDSISNDKKTPFYIANKKKKLKYKSPRQIKNIHHNNNESGLVLSAQETEIKNPINDVKRSKQEINESNESLDERIDEEIERNSQNSIMDNNIISYNVNEIEQSQNSGKNEEYTEMEQEQNELNNDMMVTYNVTNNNEHMNKENDKLCNNENEYNEFNSISVKNKCDETLKKKMEKKKSLKNKNLDHNNNVAHKNSLEIKTLKENIKMVSSSDAINSLKFMKQSILNDL